MPSCILRYLVKGVAGRDDPSTAADACEEMRAVLGDSGEASAHWTAEGLEVKFEVTDAEVFSKPAFESFIYEQVLWHAIIACCKMDGDKFEFRLLSTEIES